jgi:hypothetical protein
MLFIQTHTVHHLLGVMRNLRPYLLLTTLGTRSELQETYENGNLNFFVNESGGATIEIKNSPDQGAI